MRGRVSARRHIGETVADKRFTGVIPPVVVPLTKERELDVPSFERNINRMIEAGVDGLFILGSSSEVVFSTGASRCSPASSTPKPSA